MAEGVYDVIVIGAGVMGSSSAYHLAKKNKKTLLLEQFPLLHQRGSSHGHSRITRLAYEDDFYVNMMTDAFKMYDDLERETGTQVFINCGCLAVGQEGCHFLREIRSSLESVSALHDCINPAQMRQRYPMFTYPDNYAGVLDRKGGLLKADYFLQALQTVFRKRGGEIRDSESVVDISPGSEVTVTTSKGKYRAPSVVIAVGSWAEKVLKPLGIELPLKAFEDRGAKVALETYAPRDPFPMRYSSYDRHKPETLRVTVAYWKELKPGTHSTDRFPCFIEHGGSAPYDVWGLPSSEYPGYAKVTLHTGPEISPEARDQPEGQWVYDRVSNYVKKHLPGLQSTPSILEHCIYTNTPDENFILDHHPKHKNIIIAAGFSGHGFKLSPAVGLALSDMATGRTPKYNMQPFKISRFNKTSNL